MHISLAAEKIFSLWGFPITNSLIATAIVSCGLIIFFFFLKSKSPKSGKSPKGIYNAVEALIEGWLGVVDGVTNDRQKSLKFFPIITTIFLFVVFSNWFGLIPGVGTLMVKPNEEVIVEKEIEKSEIDSNVSEVEIDATENLPAVLENTEEGVKSKADVHKKPEFVPLLRPANADLNTTLALAVIAVISMQVFSILAAGVFRHIKKYFSVNPLMMLVGVLEMFGEISKTISFSFRLFGNIFAGEVLLTVIAALVPFIAPLPFYVLEIFVGFIQGLVFAMLTLVFLQVATAEH